MSKHVAVLMGGLSSERDVSLSSGKGVMAALEKLGYRASAVDVSRHVADDLKQLKPDVAFIALHGTYGEDGCIQGLLEVMGIPYTHSGVQASAIAMDKVMTIAVLEQYSVLFPKGMTADRETVLAGNLMPCPYVIKPAADGSSVGVMMVTKDSGKLTSDELLPKTCERFLVEQYIPGMELSCAVLDGKPLGVIELKPKSGFYDYTNKYTDNKTEHVMPAPLPEAVYQHIMETAALAHEKLGCHGISRSDFRYDVEGDGKAYMLEINTHPGLTPLSLAPEMAKYSGIPFEELVRRLVESARCDH